MLNPGLTNKKIFELAGVGPDAGNRCLRNPEVKAVLRELREQITLDTQITLKRVMLEESCVAFCDPLDLFCNKGTIIAPHELPERVRRAIASIEIIDTITKAGEKQTKYKYKFWDKGKSLERISKHLGLYEKDNVQKGVRMYFLRADDEAVPKIEDSPDFIEAEFTKLKGDKPIALLE
jgi:phage terminase small subunit